MINEILSLWNAGADMDIIADELNIEVSVVEDIIGRYFYKIA